MNLKDFIITIPNVLPADEYYELLDYCEETSDFQRQEKSPPHGEINTGDQYGMRYDIKLDSGRIHDLVRKAFIFGMNEAVPHYDYFLPPNFFHTTSGYWLLKYKEGDFLTCHNDFQAEAGSITMSFNINDDYEGGELAFWKDYAIPTQKNCVHVFPSSFLYPHEVYPITRGIRYSAITWFGYEQGSRNI